MDFADVKAIMSNAGSALMGIGKASGEDRAALAAQQAIESPLIEVNIEGAKGVLFNVTGGYDMSMAEIQEAAEIITNAVSPDANIIFGTTLKPELQDELIITVIATGFDNEYFAEQAATLDTPDDVEAKDDEDNTEHSDVSDDVVEEVDMTLDQDSVAADFADDSIQDIWNHPPQEEEDESDMPAFLRRRKKNNREE